jgi:hypothetical protein
MFSDLSLTGMKTNQQTDPENLRSDGVVLAPCRFSSPMARPVAGDHREKVARQG